MEQKTFTLEEWKAEAVRRFGTDPMSWKFVCPSCGHVASVKDWRDLGASEGEVAFSCVGRHVESASAAFKKDGGPCNYAGGGLFRLNPVKVVFEDDPQHPRETFDFAEADHVA